MSDAIGIALLVYAIGFWLSLLVQGLADFVNVWHDGARETVGEHFAMRLREIRAAVLWPARLVRWAARNAKGKA